MITSYAGFTFVASKASYRAICFDTSWAFASASASIAAILAITEGGGVGSALRGENIDASEKGRVNTGGGARIGTACELRYRLSLGTVVESERRKNRA